MMDNERPQPTSVTSASIIETDEIIEETTGECGSTGIIEMGQMMVENTISSDDHFSHNADLRRRNARVICIVCLIINYCGVCISRSCLGPLNERLLESMTMSQFSSLNAVLFALVLVSQVISGLIFEFSTVTTMKTNHHSGNQQKYDRTLLVIIVVSGILQSIGFIILSISHSYPIFLLSRIIQGIGTGTVTLSCLKLLELYYPRNQLQISQIFGILLLFGNISIVFTILQSHLLSKYDNWRSFFIGVSIVLFCSTVLFGVFSLQSLKKKQSNVNDNRRKPNSDENDMIKDEENMVDKIKNAILIIKQTGMIHNLKHILHMILLCLIYGLILIPPALMPSLWLTKLLMSKFQGRISSEIAQLNSVLFYIVSGVSALLSPHLVSSFTRFVFILGTKDKPQKLVKRWVNFFTVILILLLNSTYFLFATLLKCYSMIGISIAGLGLGSVPLIYKLVRECNPRMPELSSAIVSVSGMGLVALSYPVFAKYFRFIIGSDEIEDATISHWDSMIRFVCYIIILSDGLLCWLLCFYF